MSPARKPAKAKRASRPASRRPTASKLSKDLEQRLAEALAQQAATAEILRVIRSSPTDAQPVFDTIARSAVRLCDASYSVVGRYDGELVHLAAYEHVRAEGVQAIKDRFPLRPSRATTTSRAILDRAVVHVPDVLDDADYDKSIALHMPGMDGVDLARAMRARLGGATPPLILFTSLGRREARAEAEGFAAYLSKPIKPSQLFDALVSVLPDQPVHVPQRGAPRSQFDPEMAGRHPLRILLAEDNVVNQKLALRLLAQMGYRADLAANGLEAVDAVARQTYDVVLMDVQMPELDGFEASREIVRRWPGPGRPRIVAMTAGIVNQIVGDGLMAIFGAPLPRPDHRERAVHAALDMLELVEEFNREQVMRGGAEIRIGVGVASGSLIAGFTGTQQRVTYTCVGDTVNVAAHLEAHTKVVGRPILIDENTRGGLGEKVRVESLGPAQLKTRSRAVQVYSVAPSPRG